MAEPSRFRTTISLRDRELAAFTRERVERDFKGNLSSYVSSLIAEDMNRQGPSDALRELIEAVGKVLNKNNLQFEEGNEGAADFILTDHKLGLICQIAWKRDRGNLDAFFHALKETLKLDVSNLIVICNDEIVSRDFSAWSKFKDEDRYFDRIGLCKLSELPAFLSEVLEKIADDQLLKEVKKELGVD
jgi:hypothetical protein